MIRNKETSAPTQTQTQDTLAEVLCSSPAGSLIDVPTRNDNLYSFHPADTIINTYSKTFHSNSFIEDQYEDITINNTESEIIEVFQSEFINSQKIINHNHQNINIVSSSPVTQNLLSDVFHSAQSPSENELITSSSPVITQHTQPIDSTAPSAQLTSFRLQSPIKINNNNHNNNNHNNNHNNNCLIPKKSDLLVTQESFTVPNLISPSKYPSTPTTQHNHNPNSVYSTAIQSLRSSPRSSPFSYEIKKSNIKYKGSIKTKESSPFLNVSTRLIPMKRNLQQETNIFLENDQESQKQEHTEENVVGVDQEGEEEYIQEDQEVLGSGSSEDEDDSNISIIEVTRTIKRQKKSVIQVLSSPGFTKNSSPILSPIRSLNNKDQLDSNDDGGEEKEQNDDVYDDEFNMMSIDEIKKKIMQYGLKPAKSKLKMIQSLREVNKLLSQDSILKLSQSLNFNQSQALIKSEIFNKIDKILSTDSKLMEMIYTFEPLSLKDLENCLTKNNMKIDDMVLKEWCDRNSICLIE